MRLRSELVLKMASRFLLCGNGMGEVCLFACGNGCGRRAAVL